MGVAQTAERCRWLMGEMLAVLLWTGMWTSVWGQFESPTESMETSTSVMKYVPPGREIRQALSQAREALKQSRSADAFGLLQRLIDLPEDYFTDRTMQNTVKSEALRILQGLTSTEQEAYELLHTAAAQQLLTAAKAAGNTERLAEVQRRYPFLAAGLEAGELLALEALDHGRAWQAATSFAVLRQSPFVDADRIRHLGMREVFAWHRAGQSTRAAELLLELTSQSREFRAHVAGRDVPQFEDAAQAGRWLTQVLGAPGHAIELQSAAWLSARGSAAGAVAVQMTGPIGGPAWRVQHLAELEATLPGKSGLPSGGVLSQLMDYVEEPLQDLEQPVWTTATPVVVGDVMVFRTPRDIVAVDRKTGAVRWRSVLTDPEFDELWSNLRTVNPEMELTEYLRERLYDDWTYGSLSSDGEHVFSVDGLKFQPATDLNANNFRVNPQNGDLEWEAFNRLAAYELAGGRLAWEIGGDRLEAAGEFSGYFFLGPPLACDGKLFLLAEVQGELRLIVLDSNPAGVEKIWSQPLVIPALAIHQFEDRRRTGLMPACSNGIVICPTGAGAVIAVDFALRRLLWSFEYSSTNPAAMPGMHPLILANRARMNRQSLQEEDDRGWLDGNAVIADGRVFIAPTDSNELHCLHLVDGSVQWTVPRERGIYLAGADGERVVVVSQDRIEALNVADGTPAWPQPIHIPPTTGRGVWMEKRYLAPLSTGDIVSIDLTSGRVLARSKLPGGQVPGNLAAVNGALVSLSARQAFGFRSVQETEQQAALRLAVDPQDAAALAERGELRLHAGEFQAGLADLRASTALRPEPYAKSVLAAALLDVLRTDFARYRDTVPELEALTENHDLRHEFQWLVARGLQQIGDPLAAFERMTHVVDDGLDELTAEHFGAPLKTRTDRRLRGLFESIYESASVDDQAKLDQKITSRLPPKETPDGGDAVGPLRRYLAAFAFHPSAAEARQRLVSRLDPETDAAEWEIESSRLAEQSDPTVAGPATASLLRRAVAHRRLEEAARWFSLLESRFAEVPVESELTGSQLVEQLRKEPEWAEAEKQPLPWPAGEIEVKRNNRNNGDSMLIRAAVVGPVPDRYRGWSFETDRQGLLLIARDHLARQRWRLNRGNAGNGGDQFYQQGQHKVVLHDRLIGWSNGSHFWIAADIEPERNPPRVLWHESLLPPGSTGTAANNMIFGNPRAPFPVRQRGVDPRIAFSGLGPGLLAAITDSAVIYHNGRKLFAADPLTGKLLWSRKDLPSPPGLILADNELVTVDNSSLLPVIGLQAPVLQRAGAVRLLRTVDGEQISQVNLPAGILDRISVSRVLRSEDPEHPVTGPLPLEVYDVVRGEPVWNAELVRPAAIRVVDRRDVFTIEENRRLTVRNLSDGTIRWTRDLGLESPTEALFIQRWRDRYLVVVGSTSPLAATPETPRVVGFDAQHVPIDGHVLALNHETGEPLWSSRVETTAFDLSQPVGWPLLIFAGRMYIAPRANAAPIIPRLTTTLLDKETGKLVYFVEEQSNIGTYFIDVDPDRNRVSANYLNWSLDIRYTGKPAE